MAHESNPDNKFNALDGPNAKGTSCGEISGVSPDPTGSFLDVPNDTLRRMILAGQLFINMESKQLDDAILFNSHTGEMRSNVSEDVIKRVLTKDEYDSYRKERIHFALFHYNPYSREVIGRDPSGITTLNTYRPPAWLHEHHFFGKDIPVTPMPEIYRRFGIQLTGGERESTEYLWDWKATSLHKRNLTFLCAIGDEGVGKGVTAQIQRGVVGALNFGTSSDAVFKGRFNDRLMNKQNIVVNEFSLNSQESLDRAKAAIDDFIEIEAKYQPAKEVQNTASFYFISNREDAIKIEGKARRWSIIDLTERNLLDVFTQQEIDSLLDPENLANLGRHLWHRKVTREMHRPFRSRRFNEVRESGLKNWETYLYEQLSALSVGQELYFSDVSEKIQRKFGFDKPPGRKLIEEFAKKFPEYFKVTRRKPENKRAITVIAQAPSFEGEPDCDEDELPF